MRFYMLLISILVTQFSFYANASYKQESKEIRMLLAKLLNKQKIK